MASVTKSLTEADEVITIDIPQDKSGFVSVQYGTGGQGTLVLEGTIDYETWVELEMQDEHGGVVASLTAAGIAHQRTFALEAVRVRKSVAGGGPVLASLSWAKA